MVKIPKLIAYIGQYDFSKRGNQRSFRVKTKVKEDILQFKILTL